MSPPIPVTVFTGFLGSGKTTIILSLLPQLPPEYQVVLLKNEFGDVEVDSQLAKQSSLTAVSEILNGCMCCVLVGQMKTALLEIRDKFRPDRIIIESSGSAFPATLAFQIRELERETGDFKLDAIITVIDAENFSGYEDTSVTAKMQAQYSDLILVNKWESVDERHLDIVMDHLFTLNESTPKLRCRGKMGVEPSMVFGLDTKLFQSPQSTAESFLVDPHHSEIETATIWRGDSLSARAHDCQDGCDHTSGGPDIDHQSALPVKTASMPAIAGSTSEALHQALSTLPKESVYRVKGFIRLGEKEFILNWAFGRWELVPLTEMMSRRSYDIELTMMGECGEIVTKWALRFATLLNASVS